MSGFRHETVQPCLTMAKTPELKLDGTSPSLDSGDKRPHVRLLQMRPRAGRIWKSGGEPREQLRLFRAVPGKRRGSLRRGVRRDAKAG